MPSGIVDGAYERAEIFELCLQTGNHVCARQRHRPTSR
jgi:hypothetical protein